MNETISMEEFYKKKWDGHKGFWIDKYKRPQALYAKFLNKTRNETILKYAPKQVSKVLDIGCGIGDLTYHFSMRSELTIGIDIALVNTEMTQTNMVEREIHNVEVLQASATPLPFSDNSFDLVIMADVIEHITDAPFACQEVRRVLRTGGIFICVTPHRQTLTFWEVADQLIWLPFNIVRQGRKGLRIKQVTPLVYEQYLSTSELKGIVTNTGFEITEMRRICFYPGPEGGGEFLKYVTLLFTKLDYDKFLKIENYLGTIMVTASKLEFWNHKMIVIAKKI